MNIQLLEYFEQHSKRQPNLDLRMLIVLNLISSTLVLFSNRMETTISAFLVSLMALIAFKMFKQAFYYFLFFFASIFFVLILPHLTSAGFVISIAKVLGIFVFFAGKILPFIMIAHIIFTKISVNYLVSSLRKLRLHRGILLSLVVALRYLPTAKQEFVYIKDAMRLRGIELSFKNFIKSPLNVIEFSLVPLLFRNVTVAEEMSASATVKGIEFVGKQSSFLPIKMRIVDYVFVILALAFLIWSFLDSWKLDFIINLFKEVAL